MANQRRMHRVAERIREVLAIELLHANDERFQLVSITRVMITADLREAKVYWNVSGSSNRRIEVENAFEKAKGYFRSSLSKKLDIKHTPSLTFFYDDTLDTVEEVDRLLAEVRTRELE